MKKSMTFKINDVTELSPIVCDEYIFGNHVFSVENCKEITGHNDSVPYVAILYHNGQPLADCYNDGWGGPTQMTPMVSKEEFNHLNDYVSQFQWCMANDNYHMKFSLEMIADELAYMKLYCK